MIVKALPLTLLKVVNKSGTGKTSGKPYDFCVATVVDEDTNVFQMNVSDDLAIKNGKDVLLAESFRNIPILADVRFSPKGFDISGTLVDFEVAEK